MPFTKVLPDKNQINIEIDKFVPFKGYQLERFKKGQRFQDMLDEIPEHKIYCPIHVRPISNGKYEILDGHYRVAAAEELKIRTIPAQVYEGLTYETALSHVSDTNPIGLLLKHGIDIYANNYKESENYKKIENARVSIGGNFSMALDEYIERFLLTDCDIHDFYESVYDLGDPSELSEEDYKYDRLACEIIQIVDPDIAPQITLWENSKKTGNNDMKDLKNFEWIEDKINATVRQLYDYTRQLKKYLNFDLNLFDYNIIQNKRERAKILYFIFMLKKDFSHINILELLSRPSMENIDNSFFGWETSNGKYIRAIKHAIEKEISLNLKNNTKEAVSHIVNQWGSRMQYMCTELECLADAGFDDNDYINLLKYSTDIPFVPEKNKKGLYIPPTPLQILYLRIIQYEYLGQMKDLLTIYSLQDNIEYFVSPEYVKEMVRFQTSQIQLDKLDKYFEPEKVQQIAKYVYLKPNTDKEERRRIRNCKVKVLKLLSFLSLAYPETNAENEITELMLISCLQAILVKTDDKVFEYTFHGFEGEKGKRKGKIYVQAALKNDKYVYDALKVYWIHKAKNCLYANMGKYQLRKNLREIERICVHTLEKILRCSTIEEMLNMHNFYNNKLTE